MCLFLFNLLNELGKEINARLVGHFITFSQLVSKFSYTGARMLDSIYHICMTLILGNRMFGVFTRHAVYPLQLPAPYL